VSAPGKGGTPAPSKPQKGLRRDNGGSLKSGKLKNKHKTLKHRDKKEKTLTKTIKQFLQTTNF